MRPPIKFHRIDIHISAWLGFFHMQNMMDQAQESLEKTVILDSLDAEKL